MVLTTPVPPTRCPHCGRLLGAATSVGGDVRPTPGDPTVCLACGRTLVFDDELRPRAVPEGWLETLPGNVRSVIEQAQQLALEYQRRRGRRPLEES